MGLGDPQEETKNLGRITSAAVEELNKVAVIQQASSVYHGVVQRFKATKFLHDKIANQQQSTKLLNTKTGIAVDDFLANVARKARHNTISSIFAIFLPKDVSRFMGRLMLTLSDYLIVVFHLFFRFFLPFFLLRWGIDIALFASELSLAFWRDFARWDFFRDSDFQTTSNGKDVAAAEVNGERSDTQVETSDRVLRPRSVFKSFFSSLISLIFGLFYKFLQFVYYMTNLLNLFVIMPFLSIMVMLLSKISDILHELAGLDEYSEEKERHKKLREYLAKGPQENETGKKYFFLDNVLDFYFGVILRVDFIATKMQQLGIRRPIKLFRNLSRFLKSKIREWQERGLVPYLRIDPSYNERRDLDFKPADSSSDDSIEYADDVDMEDASFQDAGEADGKEAKKE